MKLSDNLYNVHIKIFTCTYYFILTFVIQSYVQRASCEHQEMFLHSGKKLSSQKSKSLKNI